MRRLAILLLPALAFGQSTCIICPSVPMAAQVGMPTLGGFTPQIPVVPTVGVIRLTASFSPQPSGTFKAAFGSNVKGLMLMSATVCNQSTAWLDVDAGRVYQAAETRVSVVHPALIPITIRAARKKNVLYRAASAAEWGSALAAILTAGGSVAVDAAWRVVFPILTMGAHRLRDEFDSDFPVGELDQYFLAGPLRLGPEGCATRLMMARAGKSQQPFMVEVK